MSVQSWDQLLPKGFQKGLLKQKVLLNTQKSPCVFRFAWTFLKELNQQPDPHLQEQDMRSEFKIRRGNILNLVVKYLLINKYRQEFVRCELCAAIRLTWNLGISTFLFKGGIYEIFLCDSRRLPNGRITWWKDIWFVRHPWTLNISRVTSVLPTSWLCYPRKIKRNRFLVPQTIGARNT